MTASCPGWLRGRTGEPPWLRTRTGYPRWVRSRWTDKRLRACEDQQLHRRAVTLRRIRRRHSPADQLPERVMAALRRGPVVISCPVPADLGIEGFTEQLRQLWIQPRIEPAHVI